MTEMGKFGACRAPAIEGTGWGEMSADDRTRNRGIEGQGKC